MLFNFYLSKDSSNYIIYLSFYDSFSDKKFALPTPLMINEQEWNHKLERPHNIYSKKNKHIIRSINKIKLHIPEIIKKKKYISGKQLTKSIEQLCHEKETIYPKNTLLYFMKKYIEDKRELICNSTLKRYYVFYHLICRFEGCIEKRIIINQINLDFIKRFLQFGQQEEYSENTIYRTIHFIKTILNYAERLGKKTSIREIHLKREKQRKEIVTLDESEIEQIKKTDVPKELQDAKSWLIISCFSGQRFSDFIKFSNNTMFKVNQNMCLKFFQQKTQKEIVLPIHPVIKEILIKQENIFPKELSIKKYNEQIKKVAELSQINTLTKAKKRIGFRAREVEIEKHKLMSSHVGRRSFATNFYGKIPTPLLMLATGHSTEKMFLKYINPMDNG